MANEIADEKVETVDDIIGELADDIDAEEEPKEDEEELEAKDDKKDKEDNEEELKEEEEIEFKEDEEDKFIDVPNRKAILKAYPDIFKTFPGIERALYREKSYAELFPTPKDAEEAVENLKELKQFESEVMSGSLESVLKSVKDNNPEGYGKIATNYLAILAKVDEPTYYRTIGLVLDIAIYNAFISGKNQGGEDGEQLQLAAQLLNKFIKGDPNIRVPQTNKPPQEDEGKKKLETEKQQYEEQRLNDAVDDVQSRVENAIKSAVENNIDRKEQMTSYVRSRAIKDVMSIVDDEIENDTRFKNHLDKLWIDARRDNYSRLSKEKIQNAIKAKAKSVLPDAIRKVRADALKGSLPKAKEESTERKTAKEERPARKTSERKEEDNGRPNRRMSTLDFLNS